MIWYKGKILISTPETSGDIFSRSVVLIIEHDEEGAFGLILNKRNKIMSREITEILDFDLDIYEGGPVAKDKTFFLIKGKNTQNYLQIDSDFYFTTDFNNVIPELFDENIPIENVKIFSGYSGWGAQQLETEIAHHYWIVIEEHSIDYTAPVSTELWKELMKKLGGNFLLWANTPDDIMMN